MPVGQMGMMIWVRMTSISSIGYISIVTTSQQDSKKGLPVVSV